MPAGANIAQPWAKISFVRSSQIIDVQLTKIVPTWHHLIIEILGVVCKVQSWYHLAF